MPSRLSIRVRLTAWYSLSLTVMLGLLAVASYFAMRASMYRAVDVDLRYRLLGIEEFIESRHRTGLDELLGDIANENTLGVLFRLFDADGKLLYQSEPLASHHFSTPAPRVSGASIAYRDGAPGTWPVRLAAQQVSFKGRPLIVEATQPLRFHYASLHAFMTSLLIGLPLLISTATVVGYWISGRALAPVDQIVADARAIDASRLAQRVSVPPAHDELRRLSETLNSMLDRIEVSVTRIRQFTADASHELRGPLALIQMAAELSLRRERTRDELVQAMGQILQESKRTSELVGNLLVLARADSDEAAVKRAPVRASRAVKDAIERARPLASGKKVRIDIDIDEVPVDVNADAALLQRLFFILLDNAIKYTPPDGAVSVSLHTVADAVCIQIEDSGIGIAPEDLPHVFERFWRADKARSRAMGGTGLGLSIAQWIVEKSDGTLRVESVVGKGSKFEVRLPKMSGMS